MRCFGERLRVDESRDGVVGEDDETIEKLLHDLVSSFIVAIEQKQQHLRTGGSAQLLRLHFAWVKI